jgi:organic radical activating enzyme
MMTQQVIDSILDKSYNTIQRGLKKKQPILFITGGEPLLAQHQCDINHLLCSSLLDVFKTITIETNGTQMLEKSLQTTLQKLSFIDWNFLVSPKLSCSGHSKTKTLVPDAVRSLHCSPSVSIYVKFVVDFNQPTDHILIEILSFLREYAAYDIPIKDIFISPQGHPQTPRYKNNKFVVQRFCCETGFRYWE